MGQVLLMRRFCGVQFARVLEQAFAHFEREVQTAKGRIAALEVLHYAQGVKVVVKRRALEAHLLVQSRLPGMAEGRMAEIVGQSQHLDQFHIQFERRYDRARDLGDLDGVCQPGPAMVRVRQGRDLRLTGQAPERPRMDHAVAVVLVQPAIGIGVRGLCVLAQQRLLFREPESGKHRAPRGQLPSPSVSIRSAARGLAGLFAA